MNIKELEYFVAICEEKSISRAAEKLFVGQPTLTKYVQRLSREWDLPLLERRSGKMLPTYAGERYLSYARQLLQISRNLENEMNEIRQLDIGRLRVGMPPVRCSFLLPAVLPAFHERYPRVNITVAEDTSANLDRMLEEGSLDLAFFNLSVPKKDLLYEQILNDSMYAVLKKGHPIASRALPDEDGFPGIRLSWLKDEVFLVQKPQQRQGEYILNELSHIPSKPAQIQYHTNIRAAVLLAANGYGVTFVTGSLLRELEKLCDFDRYRLLDTFREIRFTAAVKSGTYRSVYLDDFIGMVRSYYQEPV